MKCAISDMAAEMKKRFGESESDEKKDEMGELTITHEDEEFAAEDEEIEMAQDEDEELMGMDEDEKPDVLAGKGSYALRAELARTKARMARMEAELRREKFSREIDLLEQEGYRIPASQRDRLIAQLQGARTAAEAVDMIESWRELFARDPIATKIDMSRAALPRGDVDVADLVKEFAGRPGEFAKAINSRIKR